MFPLIGLAIVICSVAGGYLWGGVRFVFDCESAVGCF